MKDFSTTLLTNEKSRQTQPAFLYHISYEDGAEYFFTDYDQPITISGGTSVGFADPQTFTPVQISHDPPVADTETKSQAVNVQLAATDVELRKYFVSAPTKQITIEIFRVNSSSLPGELQFADLYMDFSGIALSVGFAGAIITASFLPPVLQEDRQIPSRFYQKTCNNRLGDKYCTVDLTAWATTVTVAAVNRVDRTIEFTNLHFTNLFVITDESFSGGKIIDSLGNKVGVLLGEANTGAGTKLWLNWWPGFTVGDTITVYPGCLKIPRICGVGMFNNFANFGGTPCIPITNPVVNSIIV